LFCPELCLISVFDPCISQGQFFGQNLGCKRLTYTQVNTVCVKALEHSAAELLYYFGDLHSVTERFLENIHTMLNEPSVGLYRVQEHVRRSLPQLVDKKVSLLKCNSGC